MTVASLEDRLAAVTQTLESVYQTHLLRFYDQLGETDRLNLIDQIEAHNWVYLDKLIKSHVINEPKTHLPKEILPATYYPATPTNELQEKYDQARALGIQLISDGAIAAFTVAGGQGTRLGWDAPKGTFPASPIRGASLFELFAAQIRKTEQKYHTSIPWYIMTSPINDAPTREFFEQNEFFSLNPTNVKFFIQGTLPSFSTDGKAILASQSALAENPDGHGGSLKALHHSGAIADMQSRGIQHISYFQVDNPLVKCIDPLFIGLHALDNAQMSSKMVTKTDAAEKVGVFVNGDGKISVIEYSDLPEEFANAVNEKGELQFNAGSIAIHVICVDFVAELNSGDFSLPPHRAVKKVPYIDLESGVTIQPDQPNAVKLEMFVFDALPLCQTSIVLETLREEEFGPIKNAEGADSPQTSKTLQSNRAVRWLTQAGLSVSKDALIDLNPITAVEPGDLASLIPETAPIGSGDQRVL